jgi:hypothetical protein
MFSGEIVSWWVPERWDLVTTGNQGRDAFFLVDRDGYFSWK